MTNASRFIPLACMSLVLSACGGGGSDAPATPTSYAITGTASAGGTISPSTVTVNPSTATTFNVMASSGFAVSSVTGCGGTLSGTTYTTGMISSNCSVTATFVATYVVTATAGTGGSISPASVTVNSGSMTMLTVTPSTGYVIDSVSGCGGALSGPTYTTAAITGDCAVTANFLPQYAVTTTAGAGGTISPTSATVISGTATMLTVTPSTGYAIGSVTGCGGALSGATYTTGAITGPCMVTASFLPLYTVTSSAGSGGMISPSSTLVISGGTTSLTLTPNIGFVINNVTGCGGTLSGNTYTTGAITGSCAVTASFAVQQFVVKATAGSGGTISPGSVTVNYGTTTALTVTPNSGFAIGTVTGCSGTLAGTTYTTGAITAACTVTASFLPLYTVTASAGSNGMISPSSTLVISGGTTVLTLTANSGYGIDTVTGCGGSLSGVTYTTGAITGACTVTATFAPQYMVIANVINGGISTPPSAEVTSGHTQSFTGTPKSGYSLSGAGGDCGGTLSGTTFTTAAITGPCAVWWAFVGEYTLVNAPTSTAMNGIYGMKGTANANNLPGARNSALSWIDSSHNLWLFGGYGYDYGSVPNPDLLNDLWKYSPATGQWTWEGGSNAVDAIGVYGSPGAPTTMPGARQNAVGWTDSSGKEWLFGGTGYANSTSPTGILNDLWSYNPSNGQWTWVGGSNTGGASGVYGMKGTAAALNVPGARLGAVSWQDFNGNLWLFGGFGADDSAMIGNLNDVWEYSPSSNQWTWIAGSTTRGAFGTYGMPGQAAPTNTPGSRASAVSWFDPLGNVWVFGGLGADSTGAVGLLNDLWLFSTSTGEWTSVTGSQVVGASGNYGTRGAVAMTNVPGARRDATSWSDAAGDLYLFGGWGVDANGTVGYLNDLWEYDVQIGQWVWLSGSNTVNALEAHGALGVTAATNVPGARQQVTTAKDSSNGIVWLFGGFGYAPTNSPNEITDLWSIPTQ